MKTITFLVILFFIFGSAGALATRKNKRFLSQLIELDLPFKNGIRERTDESKLKLLKLYENFDENERMAKILEIFNGIKQSVMLEESALTNTSSIVESINTEYTQYLKTNRIYENLNASEINFNLQTNLSSLRHIKESLAEALFHFRGRDYSFLHVSHNLSTNKEANKELSWKLNEAIQRELNDFKNEQINIESSGLPEDSAKNTSIQFDYLFNMLVGLKKTKFSHKLKNMKIMTKSFDPDLNSLQKKIGLQTRFVETLAVNSTNKAESVNSNSSVVEPAVNATPVSVSPANQTAPNKSLEETLQDSTNLKENLKKKLDLVEIESNRLYDIYQRNKLKKMNMENFITEQIRLVEQLIHSQEKTQKLLEKMGYIQKEAERITNNFEKIMKGEIFDDYPDKNLKFKEQKTHSGFFDNLFSNKDFY